MRNIEKKRWKSRKGAEPRRRNKAKRYLQSRCDAFLHCLGGLGGLGRDDTGEKGRAKGAKGAKEAKDGGRQKDTCNRDAMPFFIALAGLAAWGGMILEKMVAQRRKGREDEGR
jgi:hypothetical protein